MKWWGRLGEPTGERRKGSCFVTFVIVLGAILLVGGSLLVAFPGPFNVWFARQRQRSPFMGELNRGKLPDFVYRIIGVVMVVMGLYSWLIVIFFHGNRQSP